LYLNTFKSVFYNTGDYTERKTCVIMLSGILNIQCINGTNSKYLVEEMSVIDADTWSDTTLDFQTL